MGWRRERAAITTPTVRVTGGTVTLGANGDVNIYRSGANILKTDDKFISAVALVTAAGTAAPTLSTNGELQVAQVGGTARIYFRVAGTTYYIDSTS